MNESLLSFGEEKTPTGHRYLYRVAIVIRVVPRENFLVPYWGEIFYFMK